MTFNILFVLQSQYIRDLGLAGGMIWALDLDDFNNRCGQGAHTLTCNHPEYAFPCDQAPTLYDSRNALFGLVDQEF